MTSNANHYFTKRYKKFYNITLFDYYLLKNRYGQKFIDKNLSNKELNDINMYYYANRYKDEIDEVNAILKSISKKHDIRFLNKQEFQCNIKNQICYGVTDEGFKTNHDPSHFTYEGAKFFGKKIYEKNWFRIQ